MNSSSGKTSALNNSGSKHGDADASDKKRRKAGAVSAPAAADVATKVGPTTTTAATTSAAQPSPAGKPDDVYATTVRSEELESRSRATEIDSDLFHQSCTDFRTMLADIVQLKLKAATAASTAGTVTELAEKRADGAHQLVVMKKLNRMDKIRLRSGRDALHKEKLAVDSNHLQLQNLLYEAEHLRKEVQRCFQFKSQDEEIELVPEAQFYAEAPAEIARPSHTQDDEHARRLARLEWELQQRKQLASMCKDLQRQKELAAEHIETKTDRLESLAPRLEALLRATRPLQEALGMPVEDQWKVNRVARLLPPPLYMAYANLSAYAEACDVQLVARINGDESDVLDDIDDDDALLDDDSGGGGGSSSGGQATPEDSATAHDPDDEAMESDGEEQRARRHHHHHHHHHNHSRRQATSTTHNNSTANNNAATVTDEAQVERLLRAHPLSVSFDVSTRRQNATLTVTLRYLSALNLVTVTCSTGGQPSAADDPILSAGSLLTGLTAGDSGVNSPNPKTHYQLRALRVDSERFSALLSAKKLGLPYRWAQQLCGLDWTNVSAAAADGSGGDVVTALDVTQAAVPQVIRQIRQRWNTRLTLCEHIGALSASVSTEASAGTVPSAASVLIRWQPIDWAEYNRHAIVKRFVEARVVDEHDLFYAVTVARGTIARFECAVRVSVQHPRTLPMWALSFFGGGGGNNDVAGTAQTNAVVREIECWINSATLAVATGNNVLATQLQRAQTSLDIYLETTDGASFSGTNALLAREKTFLRAFRSRTRSRPLRAIDASAGSVIYTQV